MSNPISNNHFSTFGSVYYEPIDREKQRLKCMHFSTNANTTERLFWFPCEVCIEILSGLAVIILSEQNRPNDIYEFTMHHNIKLQPRVPFNILSLRDKVNFRIYAAQETYTQYELSRPYALQPTWADFNITEVLDYHCAKEETAYGFPRAPHNHYELLYVNSGVLKIEQQDTTYTLTGGDLIIYGPDARHVKRLQKNPACIYLSVVFDMSMTDSRHLIGHIFHCSRSLRDAFRKMIDTSTIYSQHGRTMMLCYLQDSITQLMQAYDFWQDAKSHAGQSNDPGVQQKDLLLQILSYMDKRVTEPLTIEEICHHFFLSRSSLQSLFKLHLDQSPKSYLINVKLEKSKELIRENQYTISEIADILGFSSIHYFSRLFKKYFEVSPSEYAKKFNKKR